MKHIGHIGPLAQRAPGAASARTIARMATGNPRICEFLYLFGPGSSGNDVAMLLILTFFGAAEENYGCVEPG